MLLKKKKIGKSVARDESWERILLSTSATMTQTRETKTAKMGTASQMMSPMDTRSMWTRKRTLSKF